MDVSPHLCWVWRLSVGLSEHVAAGRLGGQVVRVAFATRQGRFCKNPDTLRRKTISRQIKPFVIRLYLGSVLAFVIVKAWVRPVVLDADVWIGFDILVLSFPNFVEGIVGVSSTTGLLLLAKMRGVKAFRTISDRTIVVCAGVLAAIYVVTQEYGLHNLGGNNVTDFNDVVASAIGVSMTVWIYFKNGFFKPTQ